MPRTGRNWTPRPTCCNLRSPSCTTPSSRRMSATESDGVLGSGRSGGSASESALAYRVPGSGFDEAVDPSGATRPSWRSLSRALARLTTSDLIDRQRQADRLVEAEGASYLFNDDGLDSGRPWKLDPIPLVLSGSEWAELERGIVQRVRIIERMIADCNGPRQFLRDRIVPPAAVFGSPGFLPTARCDDAPERRAERRPWLTVYAADLLRLADGRWAVLRDVTE